MPRPYYTSDHPVLPGNFLLLRYRQQIKYSELPSRYGRYSKKNYGLMSANLRLMQIGSIRDRTSLLNRDRTSL